jgi:TRAP-type C4-dicarboxylate transport system substrate-binding protein
MTVKRILSRLGTGVLAATAGLSLSAGIAGAQDEPIHLEVVTHFSTNPYNVYFQQPFFKEWLPSLTAGKITANPIPWDQVGLGGFEMMKLLKMGTYDMANGTLAYVTGDNPMLEGVNLPGSLQDIDDVLVADKAFRPILEEAFETTFNSKLIATYFDPVVSILCNLPDLGDDATLEDLKGKTIRSYGAAISDFIEGLEATPVLMPFAEVSTAIQRGSVDCLATSTTAAYATKFPQITTHVFQIAANYSIQFSAMNLDTWNSMSPELQETFQTAMNMMHAHMAERARVDEIDYWACLGAGPCKYGEPGNLIMIPQTEADTQLMQTILTQKVLPSWAERCGDRPCIAEWNERIGPIVGVTYEDN